MTTNESDDAAALEALARARRTVGARRYRRGRATKNRLVHDADVLAESTMKRGAPGLGDAGSGSAPSRRDPQPVAELTERFIHLRGWVSEVGAGGVLGNWESIVGEQIASNCSVESFDKGVLVVRAKSTAWATQLKLLMGQVERRLAEAVGEGIVTEIKILGPVAPSWVKGPRVVKGRGPRDTYG